jgi:hypothetical protein
MPKYDAAPMILLRIMGWPHHYAIIAIYSGFDRSTRLPRRSRMDRECVDTGLELAGKRRVDHAVALKPALPLEHLGHDMNSEMRLLAGPMSGMPDMKVGFVGHFDAFGREGSGQLLGDLVLAGHALSHSDCHARASMPMAV